MASQVNVKKITFDDFNSIMSNSKDYNSFNKFFDKNNKSNSNKIFMSDIVILADEILMVKKNNFVDFTFKVHNPNDDIATYNLVVQADSLNEIIDSKVYKYLPDEKWLNGTTKPFSGYVSIVNNLFTLEDIKDALSSKNSTKKTVEYCAVSYSTYSVCSNKVRGHTADTSRDVCHASSYDYVITVHSTVCAPDSGGGSNLYRNRW